MRTAILVLISLASCTSVVPDVVDFRGPVTHAVVADPGRSPAAMSVSLWVRLSHFIEPQVFANRGARNEMFTLYLYKKRVRILIEAEPSPDRPDRPRYAFATAPPPDDIDVWTHYAGTFDGEVIRLYRNGKLSGETPLASKLPQRADPLYLGAEAPAKNAALGQLRDVRVYDRALTEHQAFELFMGRDPCESSLRGKWTQVRGDRWIDQVGGRDAKLVREIPVRKVRGYEGIWYSNQPSGDEYRFKYAGGFATYPQQHMPIAIYSAAADRTFFTYGAADADNRLQHAVSYFDHATDSLARPTILLDKGTSDAHDNPVLSIDDDGHIWIFSAAHGRARPSFIHRSVEPFDIERFERVCSGNFSYPQPWFVTGHGFCFLHTLYDGRRSLYCQRSPDGVQWSRRTLLSSFGRGHYQVSTCRGPRIATAFNFHPQEIGLNARTNLYYMESRDGGETWRTVKGAQLALPLRSVDNPALVADCRSSGLLVYLKDLQFDTAGNPVILYLTSRGYRAGPRNDPRTWRVRRFDGTRWHDHAITTSDHNYDFGSLYIEAEDRWRLFAPTAPGPQRFNTGGEMVVWRSADRGATWRAERSLTTGSRFNHTYLRRPVDAHPEFYGLWADGHGRERSASALYYTSRDGRVTRMR